MLLYIHIPFCDSKCHYCSFNSYVDRFHLKESYMQTLLKQLEFELLRFDVKKESIESLFIGGGTPSTITPQLYTSIFEKIAPFLAKDAEITSEANPNSATKEWLEGMYAQGVNRISFGVQSFDPHKLKLLNRAHSPKQAIEAIENAQKVGFEHISLDLIYGVLGDTDKLLEADLAQAFALPIDHLSAYALSIEEKTHFAKMPQMSHEQLKQTKRLFKSIKDRGFTQYEISNFGAYKSRHNLGYWHYKDYIGIGAGAVGKMGSTRLYPHTVIESYISEPTYTKVEKLSDEDIKFERIFLGLRSEVGVDAKLLDPKEQKLAQILIDEGKLLYKKSRYFNPDFLLADEIALFLSNY